MAYTHNQNVLQQLFFSSWSVALLFVLALPFYRRQKYFSGCMNEMQIKLICAVARSVS